MTRLRSDCESDANGSGGISHAPSESTRAKGARVRTSVVDSTRASCVPTSERLLVAGVARPERCRRKPIL